MRRVLITAVLAALWTAPTLQAQATPRPEGASELALALRELGTTRRVLMIGAHPDDENTAVLARLALGAGVDVAYLSLTRGEGGQNLIGPELQEGLGLIRTEELLSARRLDGAQQFFTRAYDFGYSREAGETFRQWSRDTLLSDVVSVVRRFRPDVIIAVFSGTPRDGHGQHQASGILAREAYQAAADPARFPELAAHGLRPHRTAYLFQALYRGDGENALTLETGDYDPVLGRSHFQVAMASRSRHRSQDMGQPQPPGPQHTLLIPVAGDVPPDARTPFAALDSTPSQRARSAGEAATIVQALDAYERGVAGVRDAFNPLHTASMVEPLAAALRQLDSALRSATSPDLIFHLEAERAQAADVLRRAAGVVLDVTADRSRVVPGSELTLTVRIWNGGTLPVQVSEVRPILPEETGWTATAQSARGGFTLTSGQLTTREFEVSVPPTAVITEPYFLRSPRDGATYRWPDTPEVRGLPFQEGPVRAAVGIAVAGVSISLQDEATVVEVDKSLGELRRPVFVVPAVNIQVEPRVAVLPLSDDRDNGRGVDVTVSVAAEDPNVSGLLELDLPDGWSAEPASVALNFEDGDRRTIRFHVTPPATVSAGEAQIIARFRTDDGKAFDRGYDVIEYPHTRPRMLYSPALTRVATFPVRIADNLRIGYIEGAGDDGAAALAQMGASVTPLDADALAAGAFSNLDAIIAGIRAYEVRPDLLQHNARILEWVRQGGTFVVQYNKYELVDDGFTPLPMTMAQPHGRVTDEDAPVTLLDPEHPLLSWPNRIDESDFDGWVQERGLYFADTWDDAYTPLLEMSDPGEPPLRGSLLAARVGEGHYVYTGLALFRQWPEAVPGAYRLLANLASLARAPR